MEDNQFPREIALSLSGGAARGMFHLGAISVLEEYGVEVKAVSGTSIGAIIGAALACGHKAEYIYEVLSSKEFRKVFKFSLGKGYFFRIDKDAPVVDKIATIDTFEKLNIPLIVATCDVENAKALYHESGMLKEYVLASSALSPMFAPQEVDGKLLVDGGLLDNMPVKELKKFGYPILAINLYPNTKSHPKTVWQWFKKLIFITWQAKNLVKESESDFYLTCDELESVDAFSFRNLDVTYNLGRQKMREYLAQFSDL